MTNRELAEHIGRVDDSAVVQAVRRLEKQRDSRLVRAFKILHEGSPNCHMSRRDPSDPMTPVTRRLNPHLRESLISHGARGGNVWVRIQGGYHPSEKLTLNGKPWGEWRADGNQTVIYGEHPSGREYRNNGRKPLEIEFETIQWPEGVVLPWKKPEAAIPDPLQDCIILPSGPLGLYESAVRAFTILARSEKLFVRGGRVVRLVSSESGLPKLDVVSQQAFRSLIEQHGRVMAYRTSEHNKYLLKEDARCSLDHATALLASDAKEILPPIAAIHGCPILTETGNGIKILGKGYHRDCGGRLITGGGVGSFDESLAQAMIAGRPFIQFDNIRGRIGSPCFESALTCPLCNTVSARSKAARF